MIDQNKEHLEYVKSINTKKEKNNLTFNVLKKYNILVGSIKNQIDNDELL